MFEKDGIVIIENFLSQETLGANMITLDNFPFSSNARIIHAQEDRGMDFFHQALRSRCHYKEVLIEYDK
jgi:hypothetical protein